MHAKVPHAFKNSVFYIIDKIFIFYVDINLNIWLNATKQTLTLQ